MAFKALNLGPGRQLWHVELNQRVDWIINAGPGRDTVITGGGGARDADGIFYVEVNTGLDHDKDAVYSESLQPESMHRWIGGHVLSADRTFYMEYHNYHLGAGDQSRISLAANFGYAGPDGKWDMMLAKMPGIFQIHGPGGPEQTVIKSFDPREGAQQLSMAAADADDLRFYGIEGRYINGGDQFVVEEFSMMGLTGDPRTDRQYVMLDHLDFLHPQVIAEEFTIDVDNRTYNELRQEVGFMVDRWIADDVLLLGM